MQTLQAGAVVDQYRLIRPIGEGGFGTVWLAHSAILSAHVAVKVLNPAKPEAVAVELAAVRTYKAMAVSGAPAGLMPIEHVGVIDNQVFYVLPLADGFDGLSPDDPAWRPRTLAACIERQRQEPAWFTPDQIADWLTPICSAAQIFADAGLVHRDIKPDNILFLRGLPMLSDISLLRTDSLTATRIGTPGYYAPSWYADTGGKLDMFSLAATLYTLLTGNSPDKLGRAAFRWPPRGEASLTPSLRDAWLRLHRVVLRATHEEPIERYLTFTAFARDVQQATVLVKSATEGQAREASAIESTLLTPPANNLSKQSAAVATTASFGSPRFPSRLFFRRRLLGGALRAYALDGSLVLRVRRKVLRLHEDIRVYSDDAEKNELYRICARQVADLACIFDVFDSNKGYKLGAIRHKTLNSLLRDEWLILDPKDNEVGKMRADSILMSLLGGIFSNMIPRSYHVTIHNAPIAELRLRFDPFKSVADLVDSGGIDNRLIAVGATLLILKN